MKEPVVGQRFALPSTNIVEIVRTYSVAPMVGCRYIQAAWPKRRHGGTKDDHDMVLSLDFLALHGTPANGA